MTRHHRKAKYVDVKGAGEFFQTIADLDFAMVEVPPGEQIVAAEEGASDAARRAMVDADLRIVDNFAASVGRHRRSSPESRAVHARIPTCQETRRRKKAGAAAHRVERQRRRARLPYKGMGACVFRCQALDKHFLQLSYPPQDHGL